VFKNQNFLFISNLTNAVLSIELYPCSIILPDMLISCSDKQDIVNVLWNWKFQYHVHRSPHWIQSSNSQPCESSPHIFLRSIIIMEHALASTPMSLK
jgi:hypothetical protein